MLLNFKVAKGTKETTFHASFCWFLLKISVVLCSSCPVHPFFSIFGSAISFGNFALQNVSSAFNFSISISIEQHFVVQMKCAQFETWTMHLMLCVSYLSKHIKTMWTNSWWCHPSIIHPHGFFRPSTSSQSKRRKITFTSLTRATAAESHGSSTFSSLL